MANIRIRVNSKHGETRVNATAINNDILLGKSQLQTISPNVYLHPKYGQPPRHDCRRDGHGANRCH